MKRKIFVLLLAVALCLSTVLGLISCSDDAELQYNAKYIYNNQYIRDENGNKKTYFVFYGNGNGIYHYYYYSYGSSTTEYTIKFKYTYLDNDKSTVMCYYDGMTFGESHTGSKDKTNHNDWYNMVTVSKSTLMRTTSTSIGYFVNENYLKDEIPNFAKKED